MSDVDVQIDIFGAEMPTEEMPHMNCTRTEDCPAPADAHEDDCPRELELRAELGF